MSDRVLCVRCKHPPSWHRLSHAQPNPCIFEGCDCPDYLMIEKVPMSEDMLRIRDQGIEDAREGRLPESTNTYYMNGYEYGQAEVGYLAVVSKNQDPEAVEFLKGRKEGLDLVRMSTRESFPDKKTWESYRAGYEYGINQKVGSGAIDINTARRLMGITEPAKESKLNFMVDHDAVKIPQHYTGGKTEVANFIAEQELPYPRDNIIKYVCRAGKKNPDKEIEDLEKAAAYLQMAHNLANGLPAVVRDPETNEIVWSLFKN